MQPYRNKKAVTTVLCNCKIMKNKKIIIVVIHPSGTAGERIHGIFNTMSVYKDFFFGCDQLHLFIWFESFGVTRNERCFFKSTTQRYNSEKGFSQGVEAAIFTFGGWDIQHVFWATGDSWNQCH